MHLYVLAVKTVTVIELIAEVGGVYSDVPSRIKSHLNPPISLLHSPVASHCVPSIADPEIAYTLCNHLLPKIYTSITGGGSKSQLLIDDHW